MSQFTAGRRGILVFALSLELLLMELAGAAGTWRISHLLQSRLFAMVIAIPRDGAAGGGRLLDRTGWQATFGFSALLLGSSPGLSSLAAPAQVRCVTRASASARRDLLPSGLDPRLAQPAPRYVRG